MFLIKNLTRTVKFKGILRNRNWVDNSHGLSLKLPCVEFHLGKSIDSVIFNTNWKAMVINHLASGLQANAKIMKPGLEKNS